MSVRETNRWRGIVAVALVTGAIGVLSNRPALVHLAVVGVVFATYPKVSSVGDVDLSLERVVSEPTPGHGDWVEVTTTVTNDGNAMLPDVRVIDGVPSALRVIDGSPRRGTVLRPGGSATFSYAVEAKRGRHSFEPATVVSRDPSGAHELETTVDVETEIDCSTDGGDVPLRDRTLPYPGPIAANRSGTGIEFHQTREYRRGDPAGSIDWNRYARTGELTTVEFRHNGTATVVVLVDARGVAYRGREDDPHAVAYCTYAAGELVGALVDDQNWVGLAAFGRESCWLEPGTGDDHRIDAERLLATHPAFRSTPPARDEDPSPPQQASELRERLPARAQVIVCTPLTDDWIVETARTLDAVGHQVTVISPAVVADDTAARRLATVERENRLSALRRAGIHAVDWLPETPFESALTAGVRP